MLGVSPDEAAKHKKFETKYALPFTLVADPLHAIIDKYGVWGMKKLYGREYMGLHRTTFLIDEKGVIRKIFIRPKNKQHAEEIVQAWKELKCDECAIVEMLKFHFVYYEGCAHFESAFPHFITFPHFHSFFSQGNLMPFSAV